MLPLADLNPTRRFPILTYILIAINVLVFLWESSMSPAALEAAISQLSVVPANLSADPFSLEALLDSLRSMFFHGGWAHLLGNMLFLWVFGDNIEDAMGHMRFIMFYLMCGIFAAVLHSWMNPTSELPLIGASGAVAGVIAAYLILHPKVKVWVLALWRIPIRITAVWALGIWIAAQFGNLLFESEENVAWWAHIGGLLAGATLILFMRRRGVVLFDRTRGGA